MFGRYLRYSGQNAPDDLLNISDEKAEDNIMAYIRYLKDEGIKPTTIRTRLAPLILFYEMNRKHLAWKFIDRTIPKGNTRSKDRGYTLQEIQKLLSIAKIPNKPDLLFASKAPPADELWLQWVNKHAFVATSNSASNTNQIFDDSKAVQRYRIAVLYGK